PTPPYVFPTNFPDEVFFHRVVSNPMTTSPAGTRAILVLALEAAFGSGAPAIGQQMVFARIRVTAGVPFDGTYTVTHPYGTETFANVTSSGTNRDIVFTEDIGVSPGNFTDALFSRVGPFLQHVEDTLIDPATGQPFVPFPGGPAAQPLVLPFDANGFIPGVSRHFLGDGVTPRYITGSPYGTNWFEMCGPFDGPNAPDRCIRENLFTVTGMLHDPNAPVGSPLSVTRASYARTDGSAQVDVMARASRSPGQAVAPKLTAAGQAVAPVLMAGPTSLGDWYAQGIPVPSYAVPTQITVTNSGDVPPSSITTHVVDEVTIKSAAYADGSLTVVATTSDKGDATLSPVIPPATLSLAGYPTATRTASSTDRAEVTFTAVAGPIPPAFVRVTSSKGGIATADTVLGVANPAFPGGAPFAGDDSAEVIQNTVAAIPIDVLANDVGGPLGLNAGTLAILAPGPNIGTASVSGGQVFYRAPSTTGTATFKYTVANSAGTSNVATVTVAVLADPNGPIPTAVNDPTTGAINVTAGQAVTINVLANDSANGGTLDPASVTVTAAPASGTTAVNTATGAVTYTAGAAGTFTFRYRVSNAPSANGTVQTSNEATVTVTVASAENLTIRTPGRCSLPSKWQLQGTSNISVGNTITIYKGAVVPANPTASDVVGSAAVVNGSWQFQGQNVGCISPISIQSSLKTKIQNVTVQIK
ncbi:MAG: hypothetical protein H6Q88_2489, partial [Anaeromyxobacteraceae bacterium]|nr:hypothetical protein [Anaeromyxobacteraceae bacterium]